MQKQNKRKNPKKSKVLTFKQIMKFLNEILNELHLFTKMALILALYRAMRGEQLRSPTLYNMEENKSLIIVTLPNTKTKKKRVLTSETNGIELCHKHKTLSFKIFRLLPE